MIWDEDNNPWLKQNIVLDEATSPGSADGFVNIQGTAIHNYPEVEVDTPRGVRVELTLDGKTGNCSRVLHIYAESTATAEGHPRRGCSPAGPRES